jgi:hypothetical protein
MISQISMKTILVSRGFCARPKKSFRGSGCCLNLVSGLFCSDVLVIGCLAFFDECVFP